MIMRTQPEMQMLLWGNFHPQQQTRVLHLITLGVFFIQTTGVLFHRFNRVWQDVISKPRRSECSLRIISIYAVIAAQRMELIIPHNQHNNVESSFQAPVCSSSFLVQTCFYQHSKHLNYVGLQIKA